MGLSLAMIVRILLLFAATWITGRMFFTAKALTLRPSLVKDQTPAHVTPVPLGSKRRAARDPMNHPDGAP